VMVDTKGPEMKTGSLKEGKAIELRMGQPFMIVIDTAMEGDATRVSTNYAALCDTVIVGSRILIGDNGALECEVTEVQEIGVKVIIKNNFFLREKMTLSLPGAHLDLPVLTDKDEIDIIQWACPNHEFVTMVGVSLVRTAENIETVRNKLRGIEGGENMKLIAKIENLEGLKNFEEILAVSDGVMIMRQ